MENQIKFNGQVYNGNVYVNGNKMVTTEALPLIKDWFIQKTISFYNFEHKSGNAALESINVEETEVFKKFKSNILEKATIEYMTKNGANTPSFAAAQLASFVKQSL